VAKKADAYGIANDSWPGLGRSRRRKRQELRIERARKDSLPTLWRHRLPDLDGRSGEKYRTSDEIKKNIRERDPVSYFRAVWRAKWPDNDYTELKSGG